MLQLQLAQGILLGMAREFAVKPTAAPLSFGLNAECTATHRLLVAQQLPQGVLPRGVRSNPAP